LVVEHLANYLFTHLQDFRLLVYHLASSSYLFLSNTSITYSHLLLLVRGHIHICLFNDRKHNKISLYKFCSSDPVENDLTLLNFKFQPYYAFE
jgi:hypothetical protein